MGPQYNKTGSHTPQIYFWLFPENICNQQDMLHMFIYTEDAQFPPTTIYLFQKKYYRQSKRLWLLGFVSWGPSRFGILSSLSVVFVSLPLRKSCGFWVFLAGPVFFFLGFLPCTCSTLPQWLVLLLIIRSLLPLWLELGLLCLIRVLMLFIL